MISKFIIIISAFISTSCGHKNSSKTIEIGDYLFEFPQDFKLIEEQGIDSYVGKVQGDSLSFGFDFGDYSSDFGETAEEYVKEGFWKHQAQTRFMKVGVEYKSEDLPKIEVLRIRKVNTEKTGLKNEADYIADCKHDTTIFEFPIKLPDDINERTFKIDTIEGLYRKIVLPIDITKGATGIYLRKLKGFDKSRNSYLALSMTARPITKKQQDLVLSILLSGRHK
jgi:hypothetical protein